MIINCIHCFSSGTNDSKILENGDHVATIINVILTLGIIILAAIQLSEGNKIKQVDFLHKLKKDFFTNEMIEIDEIFRTHTVEIEKRANTQTNKAYYLYKYPNGEIHSSRVNNIILNNLEDVASYYKNGNITIDQMKDGFGAYFKFYLNHPSVRNYIGEIRSEDPSMDYYGDSLLAYSKMFR